MRGTTVIGVIFKNMEAELTPMKQTPIHHAHNPDLLALIPKDAKRIVEIGCSSGALAREYKKTNPTVYYTGIEIDPAYAEVASTFCDRVIALDIENTDPDYLRSELGGDCWVFGDVLEHLRDPWKVLQNIRSSLLPGASLVACIPNAQHWSLQARLAVGDFRYEDSGLLDRTHLRWFTRRTMLDLFRKTGFVVKDARARIFEEPARAAFLPIVRSMALAAGGDGEAAIRDATPLQYVFRVAAE